MQNTGWAARRKAWIRALTGLAEQIESWCRSRNWLVDRHETEVTESQAGSYRVPVLHIHPGTNRGAIVVEPIALDIVGAQGRVDIYSIRTFSRLLLIRDGDRWVLRTDAGVRWPQAWSEAAFVSLVETLTT